MKTPIETLCNFNTAVLIFLLEEAWLQAKVEKVQRKRACSSHFHCSVCVHVPAHKHHALEKYWRIDREKSPFPVPGVESRSLSPQPVWSYIASLSKWNTNWGSDRLNRLILTLTNNPASIAYIIMRSNQMGKWMINGEGLKLERMVS
jgi:hypothetical protein